MTNVIRSEFGKLFSTHAWWLLLLGALAWAGLGVGTSVGTAGMENTPTRDTLEFQESTFGMGEGGALFALVLGIVLVTAEYRHRTIIPTFLVTPQRFRVIAAKTVVALTIGALYGIATLALIAAVVFPTTLAAGGTIELVDSTIPRTSVGVVAGMALYALIGMGLGALLRNQVAAIVVGLVWTFLLETILVSVPALEEIGKWTPGGATSSLTHTGVETPLESLELLPVGGAALLLAAYGLAFVALASVTTLRRDV